MHHKFAIIDGKKLISGSFNWTMQAAMGNYENVMITNVILRDMIFKAALA